MVLASDFDFDLPSDLIAQTPLSVRDASRLLHVERDSNRHWHRKFSDLPQLVRPGDLFVFNDTRVFPARLLGSKRGTGGKAELLLVRPVAGVAEAALSAVTQGSHWRCLGQSSKGFKTGTVLDFAAGLTATVREILGHGEYTVEFSGSALALEGALQSAGRLPLPPYIERNPSAEDDERYQTVFARRLGSAAAPTAGLHFTEALVAQLIAAGARTAFVTLDVGPGTFMPVREDDVSKHVMHSERCEVPVATSQAIAHARAEGRRVVAVGTTVVRTLESFARGPGDVPPGAGESQLFITPGFTFNAVDALVTNFHLPRSTLLMLVSAFLGKERTLATYAEAVREQYRFFSYGDAMFIERGT